MTKSQHTPTPWHVTKFDDETNFIVTNDQGDIRIITDIAEQDAALIVKAVNEYADLVACLQNLVECGLIKDTTGDHYDEVLELLAKAETE